MWTAAAETFALKDVVLTDRLAWRASAPVEPSVWLAFVYRARWSPTGVTMGALVQKDSSALTNVANPCVQVTTAFPNVMVVHAQIPVSVVWSMASV